MRLPEGIVIDKEATFGRLRFSALRREVKERNEDGTVSTNVTGRTYDLRSRAQGMMIQVTVPAEVPVKDYEYGAEVELIEPVVDTVATHTFRRNADVGWYIRAKDIVLKNGAAPVTAKSETKSEEAGNKPGNVPKKG